jgi:hypothetical protein
MPVPMMMLFVVINKVTAGAILVGSSGPERGATCWPWLRWQRGDDDDCDVCGGGRNNVSSDWEKL